MGRPEPHPSFRERLLILGFASYTAYLHSSHWRRFRERYRSRCAWQCACGETEDLDLHHLTYERLGDERLWDVMPLCRPCHAALHRAVDAGLATLKEPRLANEERARENRRTNPIVARYHAQLTEEERVRIIARSRERLAVELRQDSPAQIRLATAVAERVGVNVPAQEAPKR